MVDIRVIYRDSMGVCQRKLVRDDKILTTIQGIIYHENYNEIIKLLNVGTKVVLKPEPDNPYDSNAIAIFWGNDRIGYVARKDIPAIMPCISDEGTIAIIDKIADKFIGIYVRPTFAYLGKRENNDLPELLFAVYNNWDDDEHPTVYNEEEFKKWYKYNASEQLNKSLKNVALNSQLDRMKVFLLNKLKQNK